MVRPLALLCTTVLLTACAQEEGDPTQFELEASTRDLKASVVIALDALEHQVRYVKYFGEATILNRTNRPQSYSNKWLLLHSESGSVSRAYLDGLASHVVDVGVIEIPPLKSVSFSVYWIVPKSEKGSVMLQEYSLEIDSGRR